MANTTDETPMDIHGINNIGYPSDGRVDLPYIPEEITLTILDEAKSIVYGDREQTYGHPNINFKRIADLWSVIFEHPVTPEQVAWAMIATKMARDMQAKKRDNLVDTAGYAATLERMGNYE